MLKTHSQSFNQWLDENLIKKLKPGSMVIMGNASFHKKKEIQATLECNSHTALFLPNYLPNFNPIQQDLLY
ncbi:transposase [Fastidiosibacter lacustris]|uniref:transposase n=1 Tax=Fastidiosibacter lacustris TaxID=2056695 RepID=UPI000E34513A|nr:transposase [Fastidiosibacter lacustris]